MAEINFIDKLFENLYDNKIIYHERMTLLCTLLNYSYENDVLKIEFCVDEAVLKIKPYLKSKYEDLLQKEKIHVSVKSPILSNQGETSSPYPRIDNDSQQLVAFGSFTIWTGFDLVKSVCELKVMDKNQEIFDALWK